ncbi:MAG: thioredoxin domain-containing protein [Polyangiaceae bacterium]
MKPSTIAIFVLAVSIGAWGWMHGAAPHGEAKVVYNPATWSDADAAVPVTSDDPMWGSRYAPVTIVLFSDFQCPFCSKVEVTLDKLREQYGPEKLRIIWKNKPLPMHPSARPAAEAAIAVKALGGNNAFWRFHNMIFDNQKDLNPGRISAWAVEAGVDRAAYEAAIADKRYADKLVSDMELAEKLGVSGTPCSFVNGVLLKGAAEIEKFRETIDAQLAAAQLLVDAGTDEAEIYTLLTNQNLSKDGKEPSEDPKQPRERPSKRDKDPNTAWAVPIGNSPVRGPADALVTIVEFADFQCPNCVDAEATLATLLKDYDGKLRVVWKHAPLPVHLRAFPASVFALAAAESGGSEGFWRAHDKLLAAGGKLGVDDLMGYATELGLPGSIEAAIKDANPSTDAWDAPAAAQPYLKTIEGDLALADAFEANATPHFFINGKRLAGARTVDEFKDVIDKELEAAQAMVDKGVPAAKVYDEIMASASPPTPPEIKLIAPAPEGTPARGPANAKVALHVFSDFQCPFCKRVETTIKQLEKRYGDRVRVYWRDTPLAIHKLAPLAAQAAREAYAEKGDEGFWAFHAGLFELQGTPEFNREGFEGLASKQGLDMTAFKRALDSGTHASWVEASAKQAEDAEITSTPGFVATYAEKDGELEGFFVSGSVTYTKFRRLLDRALAEADKRNLTN